MSFVHRIRWCGVSGARPTKEAWGSLGGHGASCGELCPLRADGPRPGGEGVQVECRHTILAVVRGNHEELECTSCGVQAVQQDDGTWKWNVEEPEDATRPSIKSGDKPQKV